MCYIGAICEFNLKSHVQCREALPGGASRIQVNKPGMTWSAAERMEVMEPGRISSGIPHYPALVIQEVANLAGHSSFLPTFEQW